MGRSAQRVSTFACKWYRINASYGRDRDDIDANPPVGSDTAAMQKPDLFDPSLSAASQRQNIETESSASSNATSRGLQHEESVEDFDEFSSSSPHPSLRVGLLSAATSILDDASDLVQNCKKLTGIETRTTRGSFGSENNVSPTDMSSPESKDTSAALGIAFPLAGPHARASTPGPDDDLRNSDAELRKLRDFYESEGWLPGPKPSRVTRLRRKRAV